MSEVVPFLLETPNGACFALHHPTVGGSPRGLVLYLHPFAEEMNKSRRMAALQSRAFAAAGYEVLKLDLHGCGDSSGEFASASWLGWVDDALFAARWLRARWATTPLWFWGLRAGALIAAEAATAFAAPCHCLFWQPTPNGKLVLQQFLRLRLAGDLDGGRGKAVMDEMRRSLAAGRAVEIAGYDLPSAVASGLERATLAAPPQPGRAVWIEVAASSHGQLLPASQPVISRWQQAGWTVNAQVVSGPAFWQTLEIEEAPALLPVTVQAVTA